MVGNVTNRPHFYDGMNRLLTATSRGGMSLNSAPAIDLTERMEYSVDSSLKKLIRRGKSHTGARTIDSLTIGCGFGRPVLIQEYAATNLLTGTFEVVKSGRHRYYYDDAGSLSRDVSRGMNVSYDLNGNPVFMAYNAGSETEAGYTTGGQKLWTVHRTAAGTIPADVLSDPDKPKPTPEIGNTPSLYSRLSDNLIQSVDVTRYYDGYEFYDRNLTEGKFYFSNGYVSFHTGNSVDYSALITDYRGSTRVVMTMDSTLTTSNIVQANSYYPSGALVTDVQTSVQLSSTSGDVQTHKFTGKELDRMYGLDWYDLGARRYDAAAVTFWSMDPLAEQYYHISPYAYCAGDPVNKIDPDGRSYSEFDENGNYLRTIKDNMWHNFWHGRTGRIIDSNGNVTQSFKFADPKNDVADLKNGIINKVYFVQENEIISMQSKAGVFNEDNKVYNNDLANRYDYIKEEGQGGGKVDFSYNTITGIPAQYPDASSNPLNQPSSMLFLVDGVAHNHMNFGNFLFGAAGKALGLTSFELRMGAHWNSLSNPSSNGYKRQFDSRDDQFSIRMGVRHANQHGYKNMYYRVIIGPLEIKSFGY